METAVALILVPGAEGLEALFIRRAEHPDDPWSGHIGLPGGRREAPDADRLATAIRETEEEVGVTLASASLLGRLDDLHPRTPTLPSLTISPYVFGLDARPATRLSAEVSEVLGLPLARLASSHGKSSITIRGTAAEVPCFKLDKIVIWGLTYRIMVTLESVFTGAQQR